jgi:hypothetical protein
MAAALASVGALYAVTTHRSQSDHTTRAVGSPSVKMTATGAAVRWRRDALDVVVDESFSKLAGPNVYGAAVDAWRATGATLPSISTKPGDGRKVGYDPGGQNENVIVYAPYGWPKANGALAITVLTYDDMTGALVDADILINGGGRLFGVLDKDESDPSSAGISIEGKDVDSSAVTTIKSGKTPRFDLQNVLTHELGHFFGLGEDYTDTGATMYASTRPGETNKRIVSSSDGSVVSELYAEPMAAASLQTQAGCGGAKLARGQMPDASGVVGVGAAAAGFVLLAASRRGRAARLVPVRARRKGLARFGGWLTVFSTFALLSPPRLEAAPSDQAARGDAEVQVTDSTTHWTDGILETELRLRVTACHVANCSSDEEQKVVVPGGRLGGVTQVVGPYAVPAVGERVAIRYREPRSLLQPFHPNLYHRP